MAESSAEFKEGFMKADQIRQSGVGHDFRKEDVNKCLNCGYEVSRNFIFMTAAEFQEAYHLSLIHI
eukprot:8100470-Alexandrium_andersonii.AAC.1